MTEILFVIVRNPGGKTTPQDNITYYPNVRRIEEIEGLGLFIKVVLRDGSHCPLSGYPFIGYRPVKLYGAHIIPFSGRTKIHVHHAIETFTDRTLSAELVPQLVNNPANPIEIQSDARDSLILTLAPGIEARRVDDKWRYYFRVVRPYGIPPSITLNDRDEVQFGKGCADDKLRLPDPEMYNLRLVQVFAASGAAEVFDRYMEDDEFDISKLPVYSLLWGTICQRR